MAFTKNRGWFKMFTPRAADGGGDSSVRIDIFGEIGWEVTGAEFLRELKALGEIAEIDLRIHSPGGSVLDGWAVANGLLHHPAKVTARVEGMAASMASVIALAADRLEMPENAYLMIHNVSSLAWGDAEELRSAMELVEKLQGDIVRFYAKRTGQPEEKLVEMMAKETWLTGAEAVELGFAHAVLEPVAMAAVAVDLDDRFQHAPEELVVAVSNVGTVGDGPPEVNEQGLVVLTGEDEAAGDAAAEDGGQETAAPVGEDAPAEAEEGAGEPPEEAAGDAAAEDGGQETAAPEGDDAEGDAAEGEEEKPQGVIEGFLAKFRSKRGGADVNGAESTAARAEMKRLRSEVETLRSRAETAEIALEEIRSELETANAENARLQKQETELAAVLAECGFAHAEAEALPAPADDENGGGEAPNVRPSEEIAAELDKERDPLKAAALFAEFKAAQKREREGDAAPAPKKGSAGA